MVPECKPEWNREAITVFTRLRSWRRLQATPPLQTSLVKVHSTEVLIIPVRKNSPLLLLSLAMKKHEELLSIIPY